MFSTKTVLRLHAALTGFIPAAALTLCLAGMLGGISDLRGAALSLTGLTLGCALGVPLGVALDKRDLCEADFRLPFLGGLLALPLALLPVQPEVVGGFPFHNTSWVSNLLAVLAAVPLGACMGTSWALWTSASSLGRRSCLLWGAIGVGLGALLALGAALVFSVFKGAVLTCLFAAPLLWPTLPRSGDRTLLARMMLTLIVMLSTMFLLFV